MALVIGDRAVANAARDDTQLAGPELTHPRLELQPEPSSNDEERLVFVVVRVPIEGPMHAGQLDLLSVEIGRNVRRPQALDALEGVLEVEHPRRLFAHTVARRRGAIGSKRPPGSHFVTYPATALAATE